MRHKITLSQPTYLVGRHYNIPLAPSWNASLLAGLTALAHEITADNPTSDIHEVSLDRNDLFQEFHAAGDFGYAVVSPDNKPTDYYYIDISSVGTAAHRRDLYQNRECYMALNNRLTEYLQEETRYRLDRAVFSLASDSHDEMCLRLRAYFIRKPQ